MRQGLPQGSVLSPILFLFYINNLSEILPESVLIAMFADDVTILSTDRDREVATRKKLKKQQVSLQNGQKGGKSP